MMGEPGEPVDLYYWHHVKGFQHLQAAGRGTTGPTGETIPGKARRTANGWSVIFQLPVPVTATPFAFATWDGDKSHRDGLKYFSLWYEVSFEGAP
jgi:DMSO reductase family type II enzyme heme b subunit